MADDTDQDALVAALKATATHQPEAPNPVQPYIDIINAYRSGGIPEVMELMNIHYPGESAVKWLTGVVNNLDNQLVMGGPQLGALKLAKAFEVGPYSAGYRMMDEAGKPVGTLTADYQPWRKDIYISNIDSHLPSPYAAESVPARTNPLSGSLGFEDIRSLIDELKNIYPKAETISGIRASGARHGPAVDPYAPKQYPNASIRIRKPPTD